MTDTPGKNILLFAPFGAWTVHHQLDAVVGAALRMRGCTVKALCCDNVFKHCYMAGTPFKPSVCNACYSKARQLFRAFAIPVVNIGAFITDHDRKTCMSWAESVDPGDFEKASYDGLPIGRWASLGMVAHYKKAEHNFANQDVIKMIRFFLYNCVLLVLAYRRCIAQYPPNHIINFSGDHIYYRVVFELSRMHHINVLTHERGQIQDTFVLLNNLTVSSSWLEGMPEWEQWRDIPLTRHQFSQPHSFLTRKEQGDSNNFLKLYDSQGDNKAVRGQLRIPDDATVVALFTSNEWELGTYKAASDIQWIFENQMEWIKHTAAICEKNKWYLVIRHHPICAGSPSYPRDSVLLQKIFKLNLTLGPHVRVIMPADKITSYALIWNADAAVTIYSTIGMEAFMRGVGTVHLADTIYKPMGLGAITQRKDYEPALWRAINQTKTLNAEQLRSAYRYLHFRFFIAYSHKFKSFGIKDTYGPDIRVSCPDDLQRGHDATLDRVCDHIILGAPLYAQPQGMQTDEEETQCLNAVIQGIQNQRKTIRQRFKAPDNEAEPVVSLVRVRQNSNREYGCEPLYASIQRSWHPSIEPVQVALNPGKTGTWFLEALRETVRRCKGDYVYLAPDKVQLNESFVTTCMDLLAASEHRQMGAILSGCYLCTQKGRLHDEVLTNTKPFSTYEELVQTSSLFGSPVGLLPLFFWRKAFLTDILARWIMRAGPDAPFTDLSAALFHVLAEASDRILKNQVPMLTIHEDAAPADLFRQALDFIRNNEEKTALTMLDHLKITVDSCEDFQYARAAANFKLGRLMEARLALEAILTQKPVSNNMWQLYDTILLSLSEHSFSYDTISHNVHQIEGYLLAGQEKYLFNKVRALPNDAVILEIGGYYGRSTAALAYACAGTKKRIYTIDTFHGNDGPMGRSEDFLDVWQGNLRKLDLEHYATALQGGSHQVLSSWGDRPKVDFAFIDGSHEYADVARDLELVYPLVKDEGWIALHDVEPGWPGAWRVWRQTARRLLSRHEYESTLACGQKEKNTPFQRFDNPGYCYADDWIDYLDACFPRLSVLTGAMRATSALLNQSPILPKHLEEDLRKASTIVSRMPDLIKQTMRTMLSKEAVSDGLLHFWNGLIFHREGDLPAAASAFEEAHNRFHQHNGQQ